MTDRNNDNKSNQTNHTTAGKPGAENQPGVISQMQTVKAAWDKAPDGPKKSNALKHYQSAEKAQKSGNEKECARELEAATRALK